MLDRPALQDFAFGSAAPALQAQRLLALSLRLVPAQHLLGGRFVALMSGVPDDPAAQRLTRAARGLGMQVTQVAPPFAGQRIDALARILDQLYDAVDCVGMPAADVQQLARVCRVPVFDSLAGADRPLAALAMRCADGASSDSPQDQEQRHCRLVQVALLECLHGAQPHLAPPVRQSWLGAAG